MKEKMLKLSIVLGIVAAIGLASCGVNESSSSVSSKTTIDKVVLATNGVTAGGLLDSISYERTTTAHKFYIKTSFCASNYMGKLREYDARIGKAFTSVSNSGDLWAPMFICFDIASKTTTPAGLVKVGLNIGFADATFEVDGLLRACSDWEKPNLVDGFPLRAENGNVLYNYIQSGKDATNKNYWENADEKKFQAGTDKMGADVMIDAVAGSVLTNEVATGITNIAAICATAGYMAYADGVYTFTVPFEIIGKTDLKKIAVFGVQNSGWRPEASIDAIVKPLGSSEAIMIANNGSVSGVPSFTVPSADGVAVVTTAAVITKAADSISASVATLPFGVSSTNVVFTVISATNSATLSITLSGVSKTTNVSLIWASSNLAGYSTYTNGYTLTAGTNGQAGVFFMSNNNFNVNYFSASSGTNSIVCVVDKPVYTVDGLISTADYGASKGAGGSISTWGGVPSAVYLASSNSILYIAIDYATYPNDNNMYLIIDLTNNSSKVTNFLEDLGTGWGNLVITNTIGIDVDFIAWHWKGSDNSYMQISNQNKSFTNSTTAKTNNVNCQAVKNGNTLELGIPYSAIGGGAVAGNVINLYYIFGKNDGDGGIHDFFPANLGLGSGKLQELTNKSAAYTLN